MAKRLSKRARQKLFIYEYEKSLFNISKACTEVGIERSTFYAWEKKDKLFKKELSQKVDRWGDLIENKMTTLALKGDSKLLMFLAKTKLKHRGYVEKTDELELKGSVQFIIKGVEDTYPKVEEEVKKEDDENKSE